MNLRSERGRIHGRTALIALLAVATGCEDSESVPQAPAQTVQAPDHDAGRAAQATVGPDAGLDSGPAGGGLDAAVTVLADAATEPEAAVDAVPAPDAGGPLADASGPDASEPPAGDASEPFAGDARGADASGTLPDAGAPSDASDGDAGADSSEPMPTSSFSFDSRQEWAASGFSVVAGSCYDISAQIDDQWLDSDVPADLNGWQDAGDPRAALFTPLRRVRDDDIGFYQLACCVEQDVEQCFAIGDGATICPEVDGELFFFVNDVPGFEDNNVGTATIVMGPSDP